MTEKKKIKYIKINKYTEIISLYYSIKNKKFLKFLDIIFLIETKVKLKDSRYNFGLKEFQN